MKKQYFSFIDKTQKIKSKLLVLSCLSLFVGLTEALPKSFSLVGLDLSNNQEVLGWFIFFATLVLLLNFLMASTLELIEYYLPSLIKNETDKVTGNTLGLTSEECTQPNGDDCFKHENIGTLAQELKDINRKNITITYNYKNLYIKTHDFIVIMFEFFSPVILSIFGIYYLYDYLSCMK